MGTFYRSKHELIFVYKNGTEKHINNFELGQNGRYRTNVWDYSGQNSFSLRPTENNRIENVGDLKLHPTVKPTNLVADAIVDCSNKGDIILDLFGGSGTTMLGADITERVCYMAEYEGWYCKTIINRMLRHKPNLVVKLNGVAI